MHSVAYADIHAETPSRAELLAAHEVLTARFAAATDYDAWHAVLREWDAQRRAFATWSALARLRFQQDTTNESARRENELQNVLEAEADAHDAEHMRAILASPYRARFEAEYGAQACALWECDAAAIDARILPLLEDESRVEDAYVSLLSEAKIPFDGQTYSLTSIAAFVEAPDRALREASTRAKWAWYETNAEQLDAHYDRLVHLRADAAHRLGFPSFVELAYKRMHRVDYGATEVAALRDAIVRDIVPLCARLAAEQAKRLGVERLMPWDYECYDAAPSPRPPAGDALIAAGERAFAQTAPAFGDFATMMRANNLMDLPVREGKSGGGFCTSFPTYGVPYIFANTNGTTQDVNVLVHELGHAYQAYHSRAQPLTDYLWPTFDGAEINSMGMEFLTRPHLDAFFGDDAERYRRRHLASSLQLLAYGSAVDHFQHLVYETPDATPDERHGFWKQMEARYVPWRVSGDIAALERGAFWQQQRHIYKMPFYYIDYVLAMTCALQFWIASRDDAADATARYDALCTRGGSLPFQSLVRSAGLASPFEPETLARIAHNAEAALFA